MFIELEVEDVIQVSPRNLETEAEAILQQVNAFYSGRYVPGAGVFVTAVKLLEVRDRKVQQQDPTIHFRFLAKALFFRPFRNEVL